MSIEFALPTPLESYSFKGIDFFLKRDDLIHKDFSGNKARKIYYYLEHLPKDITTIVSYGSLQSNAMYSLARFARLYNLKFIYYAHHFNQKLLANPSGNLAMALENEMILKEGYEHIQVDNNTLFIKEGIAQKEAYYGIELLAKELIQQLAKNQNYQIFLPSGTGTTALFLSKALQKLQASHIEVFTTACVGGSSSYLLEQFQELEANPKYYPTIIETKKKYHFAKLYKEFYQIWLELQKETQVEFDLLYDPKAWIAILENKELFSNLVYIHQGGLLGNISMHQRYRSKYNEDNKNN